MARGKEVKKERGREGEKKTDDRGEIFPRIATTMELVKPSALGGGLGQKGRKGVIFFLFASVADVFGGSGEVLSSRPLWWCPGLPHMLRNSQFLSCLSSVACAALTVLEAQRED